MPETTPSDTNLPPSAADLFAEENPRAHLDLLMNIGCKMAASRLLILAGKPVVCRVDGRLSEPLVPGRLHFSQTERLVQDLLTAEELSALNQTGSVEINYMPGYDGVEKSPVSINVFFGDAAHNLLVFLQE